MAGNLRDKDENKFVPLRKKPKLHGTEANLVSSVYEKSFSGNKLSELDIENLRWYNGIEVKGIYIITVLTIFYNYHAILTNTGY